MESSTRSLTSSGVTRSYLLFFLLLILANLLYGYNYVNSYLSNRQEMLSGVATRLQERIEEYRYVTYQIYENLTDDGVAAPQSPVAETRLRPDTYLLDKPRNKTDTVIFGLHEPGTSNLALRISDYLDLLWGPSTQTYSLYYLNGQDNSLIMVSALSMRDLSAHNKESYLSNAVDTRKTEMLQQSNALDEREGFSDFRKSRYLNAYYFTLRTTFNNPGHLATIIAFDLPTGDIFPANLPAHRFQLVSRQDRLFEQNASDERYESYSEAKWPWLTINAPLNNSPLKVQFNIPMMTLILDITRNNFWLLLVNLVLLIASLSSFYFIRHQYIRPGKRMAVQLASLQQMNHEIVTHLPMGLLIYRFDNNTVTTSNKAADHLLPHLSLTKIASIADEHQGQVQVTVNNEVYEIHMVRSRQYPTSALFLIRDLNKEMMVSKKLQQAQREYEKNLLARKIMTDNLSLELNSPLSSLQELADKLKNGAESTDTADAIWNEAYYARRIIDEIILLTKLENHDWAPEPEAFRLDTQLASAVKEILPGIRRKGLSILVHNDQDPELCLNGDVKTLNMILSMLLHYAVTTTAYGKLTLRISRSTTEQEHFLFELGDTGSGVPAEEIAGLDYPWQIQPQRDRFSRGSGLTYYLCNQLCKRLGGQLEVHSKPDIGTRYLFSAAFQILARDEEEHEKLLDGTTAYLQITSDEIRTLVTHKLSAFGASAVIAGERDADTQYDIRLTDDPNCAGDDTLLLISDTDGYEEYAPNRIRANFNLTESLIDAILLLLERKMATENGTNESELTEKDGLFPDDSPFTSEDYYSLFVETVPEDVQKLYTEAENRDFSALSLTAHRLKGVFAMLEISAGKVLCEQLEQAIRESNTDVIDTLIRQIDYFVSRLLQLGSQQYE